MAVPPSNDFLWGRAGWCWNRWRQCPFTVHSDPAFFHDLVDEFGEESAEAAVALAVVPYVSAKQPCIPRISVQLFSDSDLQNLRYMMLGGSEVDVWPFRVPAVSDVAPRGRWETGNVRFLEDKECWCRVRDLTREQLQRYSNEQLAVATTIIIQCDNRSPGLLNNKMRQHIRRSSSNIVL